MTAPLTDSDLIARVLTRGDQHAFGELVRRHQSPLRGFLSRLTRGDGHRADDLAQETFLKAWKNLDSYRGDARFSTWLFGIACNEFRSAARKRAEWLAADLADENVASEIEAEASASAPDPALRVDLEAALQRLNTLERAAILLCCQNGFSHDEAARILERPAGTVKTSILRGKQKLRRLLSP